MGGPPLPPPPPLLNETCVSLYTQNYSVLNTSLPAVCSISIDAVQNQTTYMLMVTFIILFSIFTPTLCCLLILTAKSARPHHSKHPEDAEVPVPHSEPRREVIPVARPAPKADTDGYKRAILELHYAPSYTVHRRLHHMYLQSLNQSPATIRRIENRYIGMKYEDDFTTQRRTITIVEDLRKNPAYVGQQALNAYDSEVERQRGNCQGPPENAPNNSNRYQASPLVLSMLQSGEEAIAIRQGKPRPRIRTERELVLAEYTPGDDTEQVKREIRIQEAKRRNGGSNVSLQGLGLIEQTSVLPGIDEDELPPAYRR